MAARRLIPMRALDRKVLRDLSHMKGQVTAICLVIASGVATFVMAASALESLQRSLDAFYRESRFADVFAELTRAPRPVAERIAEIPGVWSAQPRILERITLDMPNLDEPAVGRLISWPAKEPAPLNDLYLRRGRLIEADSQGEVLISEAFAEAHDLEPGDSVTGVLRGRLEELHVVGVVLSPEYIYQIREGDVFPDDERFGVFWMAERELAAAFDMDGAFNSIVLRITPGASLDEVIARVDRLTAPYGGLGAYDREEQLSHRFVTNEIRELRTMAYVVPLIFFSVSAFLLNVLVSRLVSTQREQIAAIKALGYTRSEIGAHYLKLVFIAAMPGVVAGLVFGAWLGSNIMAIYASFFHFPEFDYRVAPWIIAVTIALTMISAIAATIASIARAMRLPPAEAMRPAAPARFRTTFAERLGLRRLLSPAGRMILRELERRPVRALTSCFGLAIATSILILGNAMEDSINYVMDLEFKVAQRHDVMVTFDDVTPAEVLTELEALPGVWQAEPFRSIPVRIRSGHRERRVGVMGLDPDQDLYRIVDLDGNVARLPPSGLVLSEKLAEILGVQPGEDVVVEVLEKERPVRTVKVSGVVADFAGLSGYMHLDAMHELLQEGDLLSGAFLGVEPSQIEELHRQLKDTPRIAAASMKQAAWESFQETIAETLLQMKTFNLLFAVVIAAGVVYNTARISLSERSRDLATLRVLGFTRWEIAAMQIGELGFLTAVALPFGLAAGYGLVFLTSFVYDSDLFRIPMIVSPATYAFAVSAIILSAFGSSLLIRRMLNALDLVSVLKTRE